MGFGPYDMGATASQPNGSMFMNVAHPPWAGPMHSPRSGYFMGQSPMGGGSTGPIVGSGVIPPLASTGPLGTPGMHHHCGPGCGCWRYNAFGIPQMLTTGASQHMGSTAQSTGHIHPLLGRSEPEGSPRLMTEEAAEAGCLREALDEVHKHSHEKTRRGAPPLPVEVVALPETG